jgi:hypothetical protein
MLPSYDWSATRMRQAVAQLHARPAARSKKKKKHGRTRRGGGGGGGEEALKHRYIVTRRDDDNVTLELTKASLRFAAKLLLLVYNVVRMQGIEALNTRYSAISQTVFSKRRVSNDRTFFFNSGHRYFLLLTAANLHVSQNHSKLLHVISFGVVSTVERVARSAALRPT